MKIEKTKQELNEEAVEISANSFKQVKEKMEKYGELTITFDREDFKKKLSTNVGWGFQDMLKQNRLLITEIIKNYNVKFLPYLDEKGFGVKVKIKNNK